jgi:OOP family OmpA-OmpF porin
MESLSMKSAIAVFAISASAFALPAAAQMNMSAFYIGGSVGQAKFKNACGSVGAGASCDDKDTAWRLLAGYQFNRNLAVELGYHNFGELKASAGTLSETIKSNAWELVAVGLYPFANQFGVYGKLGGYRAEAKDSSNFAPGAEDTNTGVTFGGGLQWDVMPAVGLRAEWQRYNKVGGNNTGGKDNIDVMSLGAVYRFR